MRLGDIARESRGTYKGDKTDIPIVGLEHLVSGELKFSEYELNTDNTFNRCFHKGQILFGRRRAYLKKAAVAEFDGICSGDITVIEAIPGKVDERLLPFIIQNDRLFDFAVSRSAGGLSPRVKWEHLADYELELPSIEEQRVLAEKLWAAYELKEAYKKMIAATDEMVKSQFIEMFGENNTVSLCDVAHITMGSSPDSEYYNENGEGLPFYQGKTEFGDMYIKPALTFCTKPVREADVNDILMSVRAPVGAVNIAQEHCCIGRGLSAIRAKSEKMTPLFLYYALKIKEDDIAALGTGSTFKAINKDVVYSIQIPASTMNDQQQFVAIAQQADKSKFELRQAIDKIDKVMKSLLQ